jgi:hypothetical protein
MTTPRTRPREAIDCVLVIHVSTELQGEEAATVAVREIRHQYS